MDGFLGFFQGLFKPVGDYFNKRQDIKAAKQERKDKLEQIKFEVKAERIRQGDKTEADYDIMVLQQSVSTIIDEVMIIWVLVIVSCLFIPPLAPYAQAGFDALELVPLWFQLVFVGCFISKLGLRFLFSGRTLFGKTVK